MLLIAYALLTRGRLHAASSAYLTLNLVGSAGLATNAALHTAWPSTVVNVLWLVIGLTALRKPADGASTGRCPEPAPPPQKADDRVSMSPSRPDSPSPDSMASRAPTPILG